MWEFMYVSGAFFIAVGVFTSFLVLLDAQLTPKVVGCKRNQYRVVAALVLMVLALVLLTIFKSGVFISATLFLSIVLAYLALKMESHDEDNKRDRYYATGILLLTVSTLALPALSISMPL